MLNNDNDHPTPKNHVVQQKIYICKLHAQKGCRQDYNNCNFNLMYSYNISHPNLKVQDWVCTFSVIMDEINSLQEIFMN